MTKQQRLFYLPTMFAACMVFQALYLACVLVWFVAPQHGGHLLLVDLFAQFKVLDAPSFIYSLILSGVYGWFTSVLFFFLQPSATVR